MSRAPLILFTPGPVRTPRLVSEYLADPPCNYHRQDGFTRMFAATERALKSLVGLRTPDSDDWFATVMTSTGTAANESCLQALAGTGPGVILTNGFFGDRLVDQATQDGLPFVAYRAPFDRPFDPAAVDAFLAAHPELRWCFFVSHETRMGLVNPLEAIAQAARRRGLLVGADVVSSAYAYPIDLEALDLAVTSSAKAIMGVPGLGIVFVRLASLAALAAGKRAGYYLDLVAETRMQLDKRQPRFAQPVALHAALHAACLHLEGIGVEAHFARIQRQMREITAALAAIGLRPQLAAEHRSNVAVNFDLPRGLRYPEFAKAMEERGFYLLYGIPGDVSHFQVSTIGDLSDAHVAGLIRALEETLAPSHARVAAVSP